MYVNNNINNIAFSYENKKNKYNQVYFRAKSTNSIDSFGNKSDLESKVKSRFTQIYENFLRFINSKVSNKSNRHEKRYLREQRKNFKKTTEGMLRSKLTNQDVKRQALNLLDEIFRLLKVPKEYQPKLNIVPQTNMCGGEYHWKKHTIDYNPVLYRIGEMEIEQVLAHEATHTKKAIDRASIPQDRADEIIKNELISLIYNGEREKIPVIRTCMTQPVMSKEMKDDFVEFAKENLYVKENKTLDKIGFAQFLKTFNLNGKTLISKILRFIYSRIQKQKDVMEFYTKLKELIKKHPEFIAQYPNKNKALNDMINYSISHRIRYKNCIKLEIGKGLSGKLQGLEIKKQNGIGQKEAEQSLIDSISLIEGNARISIEKNISAFYQYAFCAEEVEAEVNGNNFLISKIKEKYKALKSQGKLSAWEQKFMELKCAKAIKTIEYRTKGLDFYKKYTQCLHDGQGVKDVIARLMELENISEQLEKISLQILKLKK